MSTTRETIMRIVLEEGNRKGNGWSLVTIKNHIKGKGDNVPANHVIKKALDALYESGDLVESGSGYKIDSSQKKALVKKYGAEASPSKTIKKSKAKAKTTKAKPAKKKAQEEEGEDQSEDGTAVSDDGNANGAEENEEGEGEEGSPA